MSYPPIPKARNINNPIEPTGNPLLSGLGPAEYAERQDRPDLTIGGAAKIVPMRVVTDFFIEPRDPDPRGFTVSGCDGARAGTVVDVWVDRSEPQIRYLEVAVAANGRQVLLPVACALFSPSRRDVQVKSITAAQFADVPGTRTSDQVTLLEEDRIAAYYAGGYLYATPSRTEPALQ